MVRLLYQRYWLLIFIVVIAFIVASASLVSVFSPSIIKSDNGLTLIEAPPNQLMITLESVGVHFSRPIEGAILLPSVSDSSIRLLARQTSLRSLILEGSWKDLTRLDPLWNANVNPRSSNHLSFIACMECGIDSENAGRIIGLSHIRTCYMSGNPIEDFGSSRAFSPTLRSLVFSNTRLTDHGFEQIADSPAAPLLEELLVDNTRITDSTLTTIRNFKSLQYLNLANNNVLTDEGLTLLKEMPHLQKIDVSGTNVTAAGILKYLSRVKILVAKSLNLTDAERDQLKEQVPQVILD